MFLTICQACHKGRKLSANNGQIISFFKTIQKRFQLDSTSEKIRPQSENILIAFSLQSPISEAIIILDFESEIHLGSLSQLELSGRSRQSGKRYNHRLRLLQDVQVKVSGIDVHLLSLDIVHKFLSLF